MNEVQNEKDKLDAKDFVDNDVKLKRQKSMNIAGLILCLLGIFGFIGCFIWFIVSASQIESTRFDRILPMLIFVFCLALFVLGIVFLVLSKKGNEDEKQNDNDFEEDDSFNKRLATTGTINREKKLKLGEIAYWAIEDLDSNGNNNEDASIQKSVVEEKVNELKKKIGQIEKSIVDKKEPDSKVTDGIELNFENIEEKNQIEENVDEAEKWEKEFSSQSLKQYFSDAVDVEEKTEKK